MLLLLISKMFLKMEIICMYCCEINLLRINYNLYFKFIYCRFIFLEYFDEDEVYGYFYDDSYCVLLVIGIVEYINKIY